MNRKQDVTITAAQLRRCMAWIAFGLAGFTAAVTMIGVHFGSDAARGATVFCFVVLGIVTWIADWRVNR